MNNKLTILVMITLFAGTVIIPSCTANIKFVQKEIKRPIVDIQTNGGIPYQEGWPKETNEHVLSSPVFYDLDNDGKKEVIIGSKQLHVWHYDGTSMYGWPQEMLHGPENRRSFSGSPAVGDVDGDEDVEIVCGGTDGWLYVWHTDGTLANGWPIKLTENEGDLGIQATPTLADIDQDEKLEIIVATNDMLRADFLYVLNDDGTNLPGWPKQVAREVSGLRASAAVADLDNDGDLEIIQGDYNIVHAWHHDGSNVIGWPFILPGQAVLGVVMSLAVGDVNKDGILEIVIVTQYRHVVVVDSGGNILDGWPKRCDGGSCSGVSLGDLDKDGDLEIAVSLSGGKIIMLHHDGTLMAETEGDMGWIANSPILVDIDGDRNIEIVAGGIKSYGHLDGDTYLCAWDANGNIEEGWPIVIPNFLMDWSTAAVDDIDNDRDIEIAFGSLYPCLVAVLDLPGIYNPENMEWPMFQHNVQHTGVYVSWSGGNHPPNKPSKLSGPNIGKPNKEYSYSTHISDPDGDDSYCLFDWGDETTSEWLGPFTSGQTASTSHVWLSKGNYQVKVKAKDTNGLESEWSDPLPVSMPKNKIINRSILQILKLQNLISNNFPLLQHFLKL